jgi:hypothetical protein
MPTKPVTPKAKVKPHPVRLMTKAEQAAMKRADKTVIKRMPKR